MARISVPRCFQFVITVLMTIILTLFYVSTRQIELIIFTKTSSQRGYFSLVDDGASPVFSAGSRLNGNTVWGSARSGVIRVSYEPIEITNDTHKIAIEDAFVKLTLQRQILCLDWEMYGLKTDGGWPVCKAKALQPTKPCTVYSFGIKYDWSFDEAYQQAHGCTIRTFDPSMGNTAQHEHSPGINFYPIGLYDSKQYDAFKGWNLDSYMGLLTRFGEENMTIPYLKFDIETMEWEVLENILSDGSLNNVMQLSFEIHVHSLKHIKYFFQLIKKLEMAGFHRWFYHHRLNGNPYQCDQSFINIRYLEPS